MDKVLYFNDLFSIYKKLLTEREQEIFSFYYEENLSMSEIAENLNISRAAVGNVVKIVEKKLEDFESILKINERNKNIIEVCKKIKEEAIRKEIVNLIS